MDAFTRNGLSTSVAQLDKVLSEVSRYSVASESGQKHKPSRTRKTVCVCVWGVEQVAIQTCDFF